MNGIADFFVACNDILESIDHFVNRYIGASLLRKCGIYKLVDSIKVNDGMEYHDNPIMRIIGNVNSSKIIRNCVSATTLLKDKIVMCFHQFSPYQIFAVSASISRMTFFAVSRCNLSQFAPGIRSKR